MIYKSVEASYQRKDFIKYEKNFVMINLYFDVVLFYFVSVKVLVPFINLKNILKYPGRAIYDMLPFR